MAECRTLTTDELETMKKDAARLLDLLRAKGCTDEPWAEQLLMDFIPRAAREVCGLRDALGFYADMNLWQRAWLGGGFTDSPAHEDGGEIARCALRGGSLSPFGCGECDLKDLPI